MDFMRKLPRLRVVIRHEYLVDKCKGKSVLHLGAVDNYNDEVCALHKRLMKVSGSVVGLDIDSDGIERARANGVQNIIYGDLERLDEVNITDKFDMIIAGEIIEHLPNPGLFLAGIKRFFSPHTAMVVTTPDAFSLHRFAIALRGFEYVHPDHVCYYSYTTLQHLLVSHGFTVDEELAYLLEGRLLKLRKLLSRINFHFASGLIFAVKCEGSIL
jgi:2-polyprenyl-3-methyl-5-hydroxy-6-metoxy-1,4-benzoquinol methylase